MKFLLSLCIICLSVFISYSQQTDTVTLKKYEENIYLYFKEIAKTKDELIKDSVNSKIINLFEKTLTLESSFEYPFDSLKHVGKIFSPDKKIRIYTWNLPYSSGTHKYYGFIQVKRTKKDSVRLIRLNDKSENISEPENKILSPENWFGALYYQIVVNRFKGEDFYTLIGFDFNNFFSSKKIVEVLYFNEEEKPVFGKPIFENNQKLFNRIIFEFSARATMSLKYDPEKEMIIYDHLSPSRPSLEGKFQFYGPDFSYDALTFEDGIWKVITDIDVRNIYY